ncbi:MAG: DUF4147 domain-containing protein [Acidobacteria bacterium]|nr:MAG: DUF4147 domain-containing protein [Acidobacteriota bacterium]
MGKAAPFMARAAVDIIGARLSGGLVVGTHCPAPLPAGLRWIESSHPAPDHRSVLAGSAGLELAQGLAPGEVLLVLVSGGASSLLAAPREGTTLDDKRATTRTLLRAGADIGALNTVRKHLSAVKGGQLAVAASGRVVALVVSDVVGDDPATIGSGPTVPDPTSFADAWRVLEKYGGVAVYPPAVVRLIQAGMEGKAAETPKPGDPRLARAITKVIGSGIAAVRGAASAAVALGYDVATIQEPVVGEARDAGRRFAERARTVAAPLGRPACVLARGETTVQVKGDGRGGRNQELALAAAIALGELGVEGAVLSGGTDGIDGPTDAAGAIADPGTLDRARRHGLDPVDFLDRNDTYNFFAPLGDLLLTGPTDTNVGDVQILLLP